MTDTRNHSITAILLLACSPLLLAQAERREPRRRALPVAGVLVLDPTGSGEERQQRRHHDGEAHPPTAPLR